MNDGWTEVAAATLAELATALPALRARLDALPDDDAERVALQAELDALRARQAAAQRLLAAYGLPVEGEDPSEARAASGAVLAAAAAKAAVSPVMTRRAA